VESGLDRRRQPIGVPYGSLARIILLYLQTEAIRTGNPEVVLGRSMNAWLTKMAITSGGRTRELVAEQARRISACRPAILNRLSLDVLSIDLRVRGDLRARPVDRRVRVGVSRRR
jgi:hypothetical protein